MSRWQASADIPATVQGPATARAVVADLLMAWGLPDCVPGAQLIVSELVTNAFEHAPGTDSFELQLSVENDRVRVSLADGSSIRPAIRDLVGPRGRGMRIVHAVAQAWGAEDYRGGKRVWAEIDIEPG
jgi:two-component sensor histidine kinase